jgi:hypothetical protein
VYSFDAIKEADTEQNSENFATNSRGTEYNTQVVDQE